MTGILGEFSCVACFYGKCIELNPEKFIWNSQTTSMQQQIKGKVLLILQNNGPKYVIRKSLRVVALIKKSTNHHHQETP